MSFLKNALGAVGLGSQIGLSTGAELSNTFLNNYYSKKNTKKAYERDLAFWNMQNEYNTPENQMARLKEAGLNPNLIYGQISSGNSSSSVHSGIAQERFNVNPLDDILNSTSKILALENQNAHNKLLENQNLEVMSRAKTAAALAKIYQHDAKLVEEQPGMSSYYVLHGTQQQMRNELNQMMEEGIPFVQEFLDRKIGPNSYWNPMNWFGAISDWWNK